MRKYYLFLKERYDTASCNQTKVAYALCLTNFFKYFNFYVVYHSDEERSFTLLNHVKTLDTLEEDAKFIDGFSAKDEDEMNLMFVKVYDDYNREYDDGTKDDYQEVYLAPTQARLQRWLREEHDIHISIITKPCLKTYGLDEGDDEYVPKHKYSIIKNIDNWKYDSIKSHELFDVYEECLEEALFKGLKLI